MNPSERSIFWKSCQVVARVGSTLLFDLKTYGEKNVPMTGGVLLVANHQSFLDPVLVAVRLKRPVSFFARASLFKNKYFGKLIRSLHAFPVNLGKGDLQAMKETIDRLQQGYALNIYPEGSRSNDGKLGPLQKGVALIVRKAGVPIVPVAIDGSYMAWRKGQKSLRPYPIRVMYGEPIDVSGMKADKILEVLESKLRGLLDQLKEKRSRENAASPTMVSLSDPV